MKDLPQFIQEVIGGEGKFADLKDIDKIGRAHV